MGKDKYVLYVTLLIVLCAILGVAWVLQKPHTAAESIVSPLFSQREPVLADEAAQPAAAYDFTTLLSPTDTAALQEFPAHQTTNAVAQGKEYTTDLPIVQTKMPRQKEMHFSVESIGPNSGAASYAVSSSARTAGRSNKYPTASTWEASRRSTGQPDAVLFPIAPGSSAVQAASSDLLDAYTPRQTRREQQLLNERLKAMSAGLDRLIAQAMMPKSKREQNLAKYMRSNTRAAATQRGESATAASAAVTSATPATSTGQGGTPEAIISTQLAAQTRQVVGDMRRSYGDKAAAKASQIMNDFQREMSALLASAASPEEKTLRAQQLNQKYNEKLQDLNKDEAKDKLVTQLHEENEKQLAQISKTFDGATEAAVRAEMEKYLQKRLELMTGGYSEQEYYKLTLDLEEQQRKAIEQIIRRQNPQDLQAVAKWRALQNQQVQEQLKQDEKEIEQGTKADSYFSVREDTLPTINQALQNETTNYLKELPAQEPQVQAQAKEILDRLNTQRMQIVSQGGIKSEVNRKYIEATQQANEELKQLQENNLHTQLENQNEQFVQHYAEQMQDLSAEEKQEWLRQARAVMDKYTEPRFEILKNAQNNPNYQEDLKRLQEQAWQEIQQISVEPSK